jgi:hypothetical protein
MKLGSGDIPERLAHGELASLRRGPGKAYRRHGWVVVGRRLVAVEQRVRIACPADAARLLPPGLPERFDSDAEPTLPGGARRLDAEPPAGTAYAEPARDGHSQRSSCPGAITSLLPQVQRTLYSAAVSSRCSAQKLFPHSQKNFPRGAARPRPLSSGF